MAYLEVSAFKKLRAFFWALKKSGFNLNKIPARDNEGTPVDKAYCLNLLHSFPNFQAEEFKDDNFLIKYLSKSGNIKQILDQFTPEQQIELTKTLEEKPVAAEAVGEQPAETEIVEQKAASGEIAGTMAGGIRFPSISPTATTSAPRRIYNVPHTPEEETPKSKLYVADKSGKVIEERTVSSASTTVKKPEVSSKILIADKSGRIIEKSPVISRELYIANKSGVEVGKHTVPRASRFNFPFRFKLPAGLVSAFKNFGSKLGVFFQRNFGKFLTVGRAATGIGAVIGGFAGATFGSPGVLAGAIGGATFPSWVKSGGADRFFDRAGNGVINFVSRLSNQAGRSRASLSKVGNKKVLAVFLGLFGAAVGVTFFSGLGGTPIPTTGTPGTIAGAGCPDTSSNRSEAICRYLNPSIDIFDTQISQQSIDTYIQTYKNRFVGQRLTDGSTGTEEEFRRRVSAIIAKVQSVGINPALVLGFWKSESAFSTIGRAGNDLGCRAGNPEITTFDEDLLCAVGLKSEGKTYDPSVTVRCATSKDANSSTCQSLKQGRTSAGYDTKHPIKYPISTFDDFMEAYGPYEHLNEQGLHTNCTHTYNIILDVSKEVGACKTSSPIIGGGGAPTQCSGNQVSFQNVTKKLLPLPTEKAACARSVTGACGRPGRCVQNPTRIVLHTTVGGTSALDVYNYFANPPDGRGVGSHFIIGKDGVTIQAVEMLEGKAEVAYAVADYSDHISIEIVHSGIYGSKNEVPTAQYQAILYLVRQLMKTYNIPNGNLDYKWVSTAKGQNPAAIPGIYGHYQLNPATLYGAEGRADPGIGLQRDIKDELK